MAYLTVLSGPLAGRTVLVDAEIFSIGRQGSNNLDLADLSISRRHCVIEAQNDGQTTRFYIRDLSSANGIKVNSENTSGCELRSGDRVQLGDCVLRFDEDEPGVVLSDTDVMESTIYFSPAEVRQIGTGSSPAIMPDSNRYAADLKALLAISMELGGLRQVAEIQARFLDGITGRIPASYAATVPILSAGLEESIRCGGRNTSRASTAYRCEKAAWV
jgi:hypothetical protein